MKNTYQQIETRQQTWATQNNIQGADSGRATRLDDNLYIPLCPASVAEFKAGDGNELGSHMNHFISSSALVVNVFEYWRTRPLGPLAEALGAIAAAPARLRTDNLMIREEPAVYAAGAFCALQYEQKFVISPGYKKAPNLDVVLRDINGGVFAIESKFAEPYRPGPRGALNPVYLKEDSYWFQWDAGRELARKLVDGSLVFNCLDAAQLVRHMLGLRMQHEDAFGLLYLWYRPEGDKGDAHAAEVEAFRGAVGYGGMDFRSMTYQELYGRIISIDDAEDEYCNYLKDRYFTE